MNESTIRAIQGVIGVEQDGKWGPKSQAAFDAIIHPNLPVHSGRASSFADPKDVEAFRKCKERGGTDQQCFKFGDNGIGCWGDNVTGATPVCALPPDDMIERWGSVEAAKYKPVEVTVEDKTVVCILKDRMPWKKNITNGAIIDLNPGAGAALGLTPPFMVRATWKWA
jgi:hypothetical protein